MCLQVLGQGFQKEWSPDNALSLWKHNHCKSLWFSFLSGRKKRNAAMLSSIQENCPTLVVTDWHRHGRFCCLVTWFGREWMNSSVLGSFSPCVKHFHRRCSRCVILDETSILNQGSHAQACRAAFLGQDAIDPLGSCEQNTLRWKHQLLCPRDEEHESWLCAVWV